MKISISKKLNNEDRMKENSMMNSRLQQSIKPFATIRQDSLSGSKNQDNQYSRSRTKNKKGISRINSLQVISQGQDLMTKLPPKQTMYNPNQTNIKQAEITTESHYIQPPLTSIPKSDKFMTNLKCTKYYNRHEDELQMVRQKTEQQQSIQNYHSNQFTQVNRNTQSHYDFNQQQNNLNVKDNIHSNAIGNRGNQFVFQNKMKSLESQLTILEQANLQKQKIISQLQQKNLSSEHQSAFQLKKLMKQNQNYCKQLLELREQKIKLNKENVRLYNNCCDYQQQLSVLNIQIVQLKQPIQQLSEKTQRQPFEQQNIQLRQRYRQLLIRSSIVDQDNNSLTKKLQYYSDTINQLQKQNVRFQKIMKQQEKQNQSLQIRVRLVDSYEKEIIQMRPIIQKYDYSKTIIQRLEQKNKVNQRMQADQINYHFAELRQLKKQIEKLHQQNQSYKIKNQQFKIIQQRSQQYRSNQQKDYSRLNQQILYWEKQCDKKQQVIRQIKNDYQALIAEMKNKIDILCNDKKISEKQQENMLKKLEEELLAKKLIEKELYQEKLRHAKQKQQYKSLQNRSPSPSKRERSFDSRRSNQDHILRSIDHNNQFSKKLKYYQSQIQKLQDKIHIANLEGEKFKNRYQSLERKINHLQQQLSIIQKDKQGMLNQKIEILQDLQNYKQVAKQKIAQNQEQKKAISQLEEQLRVKQQYVANISGQYTDIRNMNRQLEEQCSLLQQRCELNTKRIAEYRQITEKCEHELLKYKQCIRVMEGERQIRKQKQLVEDAEQKQQLIRQIQQLKQKQSTCYLERVKIYRQIFALFHKNRSDRQFESIDTVDGEQQLLSRIMVQLRRRQGYWDETRHLQKLNKQYEQTVRANNSRLQLYQGKIIQLETVLSRIEGAHKQKLLLVKEDYDVVYAKYMKYRNMILQCKNKNCHQKY